MEKNAVTTIEDLKKYANGTLVALPGFGDGNPFMVMLKKPSMMALAKAGRIPNSLMNSASKLFAENGKGKGGMIDPSAMSEFYDTLIAVAEVSLVSPSYAEIKSIGVDLTDEQLLAIFEFSQRGNASLDSFRAE